MTDTHFTGEIFQGTYRLERVIGEGAMGIVYEASHCRLSRRFAVKLLFPEHAANPQALARFEREAEIAGKLGHPHIVEVVDFNRTDQGCPYIVMELLVGEDLAARLDRLMRLPLAEAVEIVRQTASALQAVHHMGVVHRDLKPHNIFLCHSPEGGDHVKVVDFGVSKMVGPGKEMTRTGALLGTPYYMAPEQALEHAEDVDARTDVYALGAILYEMLSGSPPYQAQSIPTLLYKIVHDPLPSLAATRRELPAAVVQVVERALSKQREERFPSMRAFWGALAKATDHPIAALARSVSQPHSLDHLEGAEDPLGATLPPDESTAERGATLPDEHTTTRAAARRRLLLVLLVLGGAGAVAVAGLLLLRQHTPSPVAALDAGAAARVTAPPLDAARPPDAASIRDLPAVERRGVDHRASPVRASRPAVLDVATLDAEGAVIAARLLIDGVDRGQTPAHLDDLRAGPHRLEVSAPGHRVGRRRVVLRQGANRVTITLTR